MWPLRNSSMTMALWGASPVPVEKNTTVPLGSVTGSSV